MKKLLFLSLLLAGIAADAQQADIRSIGELIKGNGFTFPVISLPDEAVAKKINEYLQINMLEQTTLKAPGRQVFDKVKWTENKSGLDNIDYDIPANNGKWLSVGFNIESMGAHPDNYQQSFVFNVQNGEIIFAEDLFSAQGMKALGEDVKRKRTALIATHLRTLKPDAGDGIDLKSEFSNCNEDVELESFYISSTRIIFHKSSCLPHVIAGLDANLDITYSFDQLQPWLSAFGRKLFNHDSADVSKDRFPSLSKPLRGTIDNKYEVVMQLHFNAGNSVDGFYYYSNYQSAIELSGQLVNGQLELKEKDADFNDTAVFKLVVSGTHLSGTWTPVKTGKALPFAAGN